MLEILIPFSTKQILVLQDKSYRLFWTWVGYLGFLTSTPTTRFFEISEIRFDFKIIIWLSSKFEIQFNFQFDWFWLRWFVFSTLVQLLTKVQSFELQTKKTCKKCVSFAIFNGSPEKFSIQNPRAFDISMALR